MLVALATLPLLAEVKSGHATLSLLSGSEGYAPRKPLTLGVELKIDEGWHTYWVNPGEGGMKPKLTWTLPEGWIAGPELYPLPKRFQTGGLAGFGYEGTVVFPVFITPAVGTTGEVVVGLKVDWLTCNDDACIPGSGEVEVSLSQGSSEPGAGAEAIMEALSRVPEPLADTTLKVLDQEGIITFQIELPSNIDAEGAEILPVTADTIDHSKPVSVKKDKGIWTAVVTKNEYADVRLANLKIVLSGGKLDQPLLLSWSNDE